MADPTVTERYYPFATGPGEFVSEDDWAAMTAGFQDSGVYGHPGSNDLTIEPGPTSGTIQINPGDAQVGGYHYRLTAPKTIPIIANAGTEFRWDIVVLELDTNTRTITPVLLPATGPSQIGSHQVSLGLWGQPPAAQVTADYWGWEIDSRWFKGARMRPIVNGYFPPAEPGALAFDPFATGSGSVYLGKLDGSGNAYWAPWYPISSERMDPIQTENSDGLTTQFNTYEEGSSWCSTYFNAPPSGSIYVTVFSQLEANGPNSAYLSFEVRENGPSGVRVVQPNDSDSASVQASYWSGSSRRKLITGLTPGQRYFARTLHRSSNGSYSITLFHRSLLIEPVYTEVAPGAAPDSGNTLDPSDVVLTQGGSTIRLPNGDITTQGLGFAIPAGDRATAPDTLAMYVNEGTDEAPVWKRTGYFNEYGELRVIPSSTSRVAARLRMNPGQTADAFQVADIDNNPLAGFRADGTLFAPNFAGEASGFVSSDSTDTVLPAAPLIRYDRAYAVSTDDPNILECKVNGINRAWLNEWGGYRASIDNPGDPGVRVIRHPSQTGNTFELETDDRSQKLWGIDPDGYTVQGNGTAAPVKMSPVLVLGAADPVPAGTPAGTVILRQGS